VAGGDPVVTKHASLAVDDLMLAEGITTAAQTITPPGSWSTHPESISTARPLYFKFADAGDVAAANFTFVTSGSASAIVGISVWRGVDKTNPWAGTAGSVSTSSTTVTIAAAVPSVACYLAHVLVKLNLNTWTPPALATPEDWDHTVSTIGSVAGSHETVASGSTGTRVWTASTGAAPGLGYIVPLRAGLTVVSPTGFDIAVEFGTPTIVQDQAVTPSGFDVAVEFGTPTLAQEQIVLTTGYDLTVEFGTPTLVQEQVVAPTGFDVAVEFGTPEIKQTVAPAGFDLTVEFGVPTLLQEQFVEPDGFDLTVEFGEPTLLQEQIVAPDGFDLVVEFGEPSLVQKVAATGFDLTVEFGTPSLAFKQVVAVTGFDIDVQFGTPTIEVQPMVTGTVFNHETGLPVGAGVEVKLFDDNDVLIDTTVTDINGVFVFDRPFGDTDLYWTLAQYDVLGVQYHGVSDRGCPAT
jgi:hypothetical protein